MRNSAEGSLYLYGVAGEDAAGEPLHSEGVQPGEAVEFVIHSGLAAAVNTVPLQEFAPERVEERLKAGEVRWVEEKALAHATVLQELMRRGPVVPVRFGILFRGPDRLLSLLEAHQAELRALLDRLAGRVEWGVKVFCRDEALKEALGKEDPQVKELREGLGRMPPGMAYLHGKKVELLLADKGDRLLPQWAHRIHGALVGVSEAAEVVESPGQEGAGHDGRIMLTGAYLVREEDTARFHRELESLAAELDGWGLRFQLSGPWPPYHFARVRLEG